MITFTVEGQEGVTFLYRNSDERFTYGSKLVNGKTTKGRPSKFPNNKVTLSEPLPPQNVSEQATCEPQQDPEASESGQAGETVVESPEPVSDVEFIPLE